MSEQPSALVRFASGLARRFRVACKLSDRRKPAVLLGFSDWSDWSDPKTANAMQDWQAAAPFVD